MEVTRPHYRTRTLVNFIVEIVTLYCTHTILVRGKKTTSCAAGLAKIVLR